MLLLFKKSDHATFPHNSQTSSLFHLSFKQPINFMKRGLNMAPIKHQNLQLPGKFKQPKSINRTLQILLSISIFSFLFLYSSCLLTYFNALHLLLSTYISDFFSFYINRQFMFILCNGILVFVTQGYGLIGCSASMAVTDDLHDEFDVKNRDYRRPALDIVEMQESVGDEEEGKAESVGTLVPVEKEEEEEDGYDGGDENEMVTGESAESAGHMVPVEKEEEDGYDGGDDSEMVTGESDERFEDFIKKTKEKMRTEALQFKLVA